MGLAIVETVVADGRVQGDEQLIVVLDNELKLHCRTVAGTDVRQPSFCIEEASWTAEIRGALQLTVQDRAQQKRAEEVPSRSRFVQIASRLQRGVPLTVRVVSVFPGDPQLFQRQLEMGRITGIDIL